MTRSDLAPGMPHVMAGRRLAVALAALALLAVVVPVSAAPKAGPLGNFKHIVVIYEENHSFDNLYGMWGDVNGQNTIGLDDADAAHTTQIDQNGTAYSCLLQTDISLQTSVQAYPVMNRVPPTHNVLPADAVGAQTESCTQDVTLGTGAVAHISSAFGNAPYSIDDAIPADATTCPTNAELFKYTFGILDGSGLPGGCTRDLVHRFYQEQYQINGGNMNRYITGSDSAAMSFGYYDTKQLPIYKYLHKNGAPKYVIADHFFQAAFGGSFLNHQFLIAAAAPSVAGQFAPNGGATRSVADAQGMVRSHSQTGCSGSYPLFASSACLFDGNTTQACGAGSDANGMACGDYAVNTMLPYYQPTSSGFANKINPIMNPPGTDKTIGDLMTGGGVSWVYYGGGWDNASGNTTGRGWTAGAGPTCATANGPSGGAPSDGAGTPGGYPYCPAWSYQQHHYPFAYYSRYNSAAGPDRTHLQDEEDFFYAAANGQLPQVSFVKPVGAENEHPGYASEPDGSDHLVNLIQAVMHGPQAGNTLIVVTYDEYGGQWDHVPPPSSTNNVAAHDKWGPGTRVPAILIARSFVRSGVDHTYYDTLSIMRTIEQQWGLGNLGHRDALVNGLGNAVAKGRP